MTTKIVTSSALSPCLVATTLRRMTSSFTPPRDQPFARVGFAVVLLRELRPFLVACWTAPHSHSMTRFLMAMSSTATVQQQAHPEP
jgi:hypothetical protein